MGSSELDRLLWDLGICGRFPIGIWFLLNVMSIYGNFLFMGNSIVSYATDFRCATSRGVDDGNLTKEEICALGCPNDNWTFPTSSSSASFPMEWRLVCDREIYANVVEMLFFLGGLFAAPFSGYLGDKFGRRPTAMVSTAVAVLAGVAVPWASGVVAYGAIRFVLGAAWVGMSNAGTLRLELFCARRRFVTFTCEFGWRLGSLLLPLIVTLLPRWRYAMLLINGFGIIVVGVLYLVPESVPWLIRNGRHEEAFRILKSAADERKMHFDEEDYARLAREEEEEEEEVGKENDEIGKAKLEERESGGMVTSDKEEYPLKKTNPDNQPANDDDENEVDVTFAPSNESKNLETTTAECERESNFCHALRSRNFVWTLICASVFWSYTNFVFIGVTFSYGTLAGNRLVNFVLLSLISLPSQLMVIPIIMFLKRRSTIFFSLLLTALCFLISAVVRFSVSDYEGEYGGLRKALNLIAKFTVNIAFETFWLWLQESFPTLLRSRAFLFACCMGRSVSALACFSSYLQTRYPLELESAIGIGGIVTMLLTLHIPETLNQPLPQTMADFKAMKKRTKFALCPMVMRSG